MAERRIVAERVSVPLKEILADERYSKEARDGLERGQSMDEQFERGRKVAKKVVDNNNAGIVTGLMPVEYEDVYYFIDRATEGDRRKAEEHAWDGEARRGRTRRDPKVPGRRLWNERRKPEEHADDGGHWVKGAWCDGLPSKRGYLCTSCHEKFFG